MMRFRTFAALAAVTSFSAVVALGACSSDDSTNGTPVVTPDAAQADDAATADTSTPVDSATPDGGDAAIGPCTGACKVTSLAMTINGNKRTLDRAQFGTSMGDGGIVTLRSEAHLGGNPECPGENSATPDYTLIIANLPRNAAGGKATKAADGLAATLFDFKGDLGLLGPVGRGTVVEVSNLVVDTAATPTWAAFDFTATLAEGTISGHVYDEYCASLNE